MSEYSGVEKRKYKRVKVGVTVIYRKNEVPNVRIRDDKGENDALMVDISQGGMAIITEVNVLVGIELWIRFTLSEMEGRSMGFYGNMELLGEVRSNTPLGKDSYRLGIAFSNVGDKNRVNIVNFVKAVESHLGDKK